MLLRFVACCVIVLNVLKTTRSGQNSCTADRTEKTRLCEPGSVRRRGHGRQMNQTKTVLAVQSRLLIYVVC